METFVAVIAVLLAGILIGIGAGAWSIEPRKSGRRRAF